MNLIRLISFCLSVLFLTCVPASFSLASKNPYISSHGINFSTGNKYLRQNDISLSGPVSSLSFSRNYNSQSVENSVLGFGWSFSWNEKLTFETELGLIIYSRADGRMVHFTYNGTDTWINDVGKKTVITATEGASGYTMRQPNGTQLFFNTSGRLIEKRDLNNNTTFLVYDGEKLTAISDGFGRSISFVYSAEGRLASITTPIGSYFYTYDSNDNLLTITRPDNASRTYVYEDPNDVHNLTGVIDETSTRVLTVGYDLMDRVISSALTDGSKAVSIEYQAGYKRVVTDSLGIPSTYQLEVQHGVAQVKSFEGPGCSSCGSDTGSTYTYDFRQQVTEMTDGRGIITAYTYDDHGNKLTETKAVGTAQEYTTSYTYIEDLNKVATITVPSIANPGQNRIISLDYDAAGNQQIRTESGYRNSTSISRSTTYSYDSYGRITSINGPRSDVNDVTTITYYPNDPGQGANRGYLHTVSNALGHTVTYSNYNGFGQAESITDANGQTTSMVYNTQGLVRSRTTGGLTTRYDYDLAGTLQTVTLPGNRIISYQYTAAAQLHSITDSLGNSISYSYDSEGRRSDQQIKDPLGTLTAYVNYQYDDTGRLHKTINPDDSTEQLDYDQVGNLVTRINELGLSTSYNYDALNRLEEVTDPGGAATRYTYDMHGNQTSVTDAEGHVTSFSFDDFGNRLSRISPDSGTTTYAYDIAGNMSAKTDARGTVIGYTYDTLNRVSTITYPDESLNVSYTYDKGENSIGRLSSIVDATGSRHYIFNTFGSLVEEIRIIWDQSFTVSYNYSDIQELISITYPSGRVVRYQRDAIGQVAWVTSTYKGETITVADTITRLPFGPTTSMTLGNGLVLESGYDQQYRITNATVGNVYGKAYTYRATGQVASITDTISTSLQTFSYDDVGRLTGAVGKYGTYGFQYDMVGNRRTQTLDQTVTSYSYAEGSNRLSQINGSEIIDYQYDEAGNLVSKGAQTFTWNQNDRLISLSDNGTEVGKYEYDAQGLRTVKTSAEGAMLFLYDSAGNLLAETDANGNTIREFVYLNGQRLTLFDYSLLPEFSVTVTTSSGAALKDVRVYGFDENNRYTGNYGITNDKGKAGFDRDMFGEGSYTFRVDYLGARFWTSAAIVQNSNGLNLIVEDEPVEIRVITDGEVKQGVRVYAFTETGTYLGLYGITDENGKVSFSLPEGHNYRFRADLFGNQYWSESTTIVAGGGGVIVNSFGGTLQLTLQEVDFLPLPDIKTYLFSEGGAYLGLSGSSDENGAVSYRVADGSYKIRADYMGYQFWSEVIDISNGSVATTLAIPHKDVGYTVRADLAGSLSPLANVSCYLFSPSGSYLGVKHTTSSAGEVLFHVPEQPFRVRADYLGQQFWSEDSTWQDNTIAIAHGTAVVEVSKMGSPLDNIKVYAFTAGGAYLQLNSLTGSNGRTNFILPAGEFRFRADYQGSQYWGEDLNLTAHRDNYVQISTGGGSFVLTVADQEATPIEGIRAYLFNGSGSYLGEYANTDNHGQVGFSLADGTYKIRVNYLGYQYWTENFSVPVTSELGLTIEHREVQILSQTSFTGSITPIEAANVYLFTSSDSYVNLQSQTDEQGNAYFYMPQQEYIARLDYLGGNYFSEVFSIEDPVITVEEGQVAVHLSGNGSPLSNVPIYVFTEADNYLGLVNTTDEAGDTLFQVPVGLYKFRADYQASKFWASTEVVADRITNVDLQTGGGTLAVTVHAGDATVLADAPCYLFNSFGTYLGQTGQTDENGLVSFDISDGSYKVRVNYLGYEYWSDIITAPETLAASVLIIHYDVAVTVNKNTEFTEPLAAVRCYLFTESGNYTGIFADSDKNGQAHFSVPINPYKVRADYMGKKYWSESFNALDSTIDIYHGEIGLTVTEGGNSLANVKVYLFSESGSYLGCSSVTDESGQVFFTVPEEAYQLRIDYNSTQYWTDVINVFANQNNQVQFSIDELAANLTNNPFPVRYDGEAPTYRPQVAAVGDLAGILAQSTVQNVPSTEARIFYYISDHLGTSQFIADSEGQVVWQGDYSPFGEVDVVVDEFDNLFRFPGQMMDSESGLYYNWHRFYDPETGRYISADPIGLAGGINLYAYVGGDPVNWVDPEGLNPLLQLAIKTAIAGISTSKVLDYGVKTKYTKDLNEEMLRQRDWLIKQLKETDPMCELERYNILSDALEKLMLRHGSLGLDWGKSTIELGRTHGMRVRRLAN